MKKSARNRVLAASLVMIALLIALAVGLPKCRPEAKDITPRASERTTARELEDLSETTPPRVEIPRAIELEDSWSPETGDLASAEEPLVIVQPSHEQQGSEARPSEPVTPDAETARVVAIVVNSEASPQLAWNLVSPWNSGSAQLADAGTEQIVLYAEPVVHEPQTRRHGAGGLTARSAFLALPSDEPRIKVHRGRSLGSSRIRVHGVGSPSR